MVKDHSISRVNLYCYTNIINAKVTLSVFLLIILTPERVEMGVVTLYEKSIMYVDDDDVAGRNKLLTKSYKDA